MITTPTQQSGAVEPLKDVRALPPTSSQRGFSAQGILGTEAARIFYEAHPVRQTRLGAIDSFKCLLIGEGTLLIRCGEILRSLGHEICAVISVDALVTRWAEQGHLPHFRNVEEFACPRVRPFAYLFSIVNSKILPQEILDLALMGGINYHDALLPRNAGSYATSWALLNQEACHGITWHLMNSQVDAGDLLFQWPVDIVPGETAFTLNAKCYEAAVASFQQLIIGLSSGHASTQKQNPRERTFHSRCKKPAPGCVVSWNRGADEIDSLLRALDFGPYPNGLGSPKLMVKGMFFILPKIKILDSISNIPSGMITRIDPEEIRVATATHEVALRGLRTIEGQPISVVDLVSRYQLQEGDHIDEVDPQMSRRVAAMEASLCQHETFWVQRLAEFESFVFPGERPVLRQTGFLRSAETQITIPPEVWQRAFGCTGAEFLLAAYAIYLARSGGLLGFKIGFSDVGLKRRVAGLEGLFSSRVPLCLDLKPVHTFAEVRQIVRAELGLVQRGLTYARDVVNRYPVLSSRSPLENGCLWPVSVDWVERWDEGISSAGSSEFAFVVAEDQRECRWVYHPDRFGEPEIARKAFEFSTLLEGIVANPEARLSELPLLADAERQQLIVSWNQTEAPFPWDASVSEVFERQAAQTPEALALEHGTTRWTYRELNARANRLAHVLREIGAQVETLVGLCLERSAGMVLAMLAVLKAGGAYVPIDPGYPAARRSLMLEGVPVLVTAQALASEFSAYAGRILCVEDAQTGPAGTENLPRWANGDSLAYVIYTSGSTGQPKGVAIPHRAVNRLVLNTNYIALDGSDVVAQTANCCFDAATFEVWGALLNGACLAIIDQEVLLSPTDLAEELRRRGITTLWLTTSLFNLVAQHAPGAFGGLRQVLFGGEAADARSVAAVLKHGAPSHLINGYGPTETTTFAACHEVRAVPEKATSIPIGKPIANTTIYVLDAWRNPVPIGVVGEIHVGGPGLARGYVGAPELTAERFVPDPFSTQPGARLYRTGDLGRWMVDGTLECLGRMDQQVKIRGFRVEPGEVEAALKQHHRVRDAVVVVRRAAGEDTRLVAYVAGKPSAWRENTLREYLKSKLPDYLVPAAFVFLDQLPLTPNGKLDQRALPEPEVKVGQGIVPPRNAAETKLTALWEKVLGVQAIGVTDNFFELGGSSLAAMRLFLEVQQVFGTRFPLSTLFQAPTVEQLANKLATQNPEEEWASLVALQLQGSRPPFFGIHGVHGNVLFYRPLSLLLGKEQPFYGLQSQGLDGKPIARTSVEAMAEYYLKEIQRVQPHGPYLLGGYSLGGSIAYELARRLRLAGEAVPLLALIDASNPARPPRLTSYWARLRKALRDPAALLTVDRWVRILAGRFRGKAGGHFLQWNDRYQKAKARRRRLLHRDQAAEIDLHVVMVHTRALWAYRPLPYDGKITLFRSRVPEAGYEFDPYLGWNFLAQRGIEVHEMPGAHLELFADENVLNLAKVLDGCIRSALAPDSSDPISPWDPSDRCRRER